MKIKAFILFIFILMGFGYFNSSSSLASKNTDLFNEIVNVTGGQVKEFGVRAAFETNEDGESHCLQLLNSLNIDKADIRIVKDNNIYSVEFDNNELKGYIESASYDNHNVVTLNVVQFDSENKLSVLKNRIIASLGEYSSKARYFDYLKAEINREDKEAVSKEVSALLRENGASNINTIKIDNGYSTTAYTKKYPVMKNDGKWIDLNYAILSYSSGDYVVIGTPVIFTTY